MSALATLTLLAVGLQASVQTEAREGSALPGAATSTELAAAAAFAIDQKLRDLSGSLAYQPRLLLVQGRADVAHSGQLSLGYAASKRLRFSLGEMVTFGSQDFSPLAATGTTGTTGTGSGTTAGTPPLVAPPVRVISVINTTTSLRVDQRFSGAVSGSLGASYTFGGALDAAFRGYLPQSRQPGLGASLAWRLSKQDALSAALDARASSSDNGATANAASLSAGLAHAFSRRAQGSFSTGLGWTWSRLDPRAQEVWGLLPFFASTLSLRPPVAGLTVGLRASLSPALDTQTGTANTSLGAGLDAGWAYRRVVSVAAAAGWQRAVQGALTGSTSWQGSLRASVPLPAGFGLSGGFQLVDLRPVGHFSLGGGLQWGASVLLGWAGRTKL